MRWSVQISPRLHTQAEDKNDSKTKMKGKNRPSKRHRKKQTNVIEEKRPEVQKRLREEVRPDLLLLVSKAREDLVQGRFRSQ